MSSFFGPERVLMKAPPEEAVDTYSAALERDPQEIQAMIESELFPLLESEATQRANTEASESILSGQQDILVNQPEDALEQLQGLESTRPDLATSSPDYAVLSEGGKMQVRLNANEAYFDRAIQERIKNSSEGALAYGGYFLDTALSGIVQNILGAPAKVTGVGEGTIEGAWQLVDLAEELNLLMIADISPEEYKRRVDEVLDRVEDAGLFSEVNPFYLTTFAEMVKEGGRGINSKVEQAFAVLDVTPIGLAAKGLKLGNTTGSAGRNVAKATGDLDKGVQTIVKSPRPEVKVEGTAPSAVRPMSGEDFFTGPELIAKRKAEVDNIVLSRIREITKGSVLPKATIETNLPLIKEKVEAEIAAFSRHELDIGYSLSDTGIPRGSATLGKRGGEKYKTLAGAEKLAAKIGGEVREESDGFVVIKEVDVPTGSLVDPTDLKQVSTNMLSGLMSTMTRTTEALQGMLTRAEAQSSRMTRELRDVLEASRKGADVQGVDEIVTALRDDPKVNARTEPYNGEEFRKAYFDKYGKEPDQATRDYYRTLLEVSDVDYYLTADIILKNAIENGEKALVSGDSVYRVKEVSDIPATEKVWFEAGKATRTIDADEAVESAYPIYEVAEAAIQKTLPTGEVVNVRYISGPDLVTRRLYHSDVLPYNAGGHRFYTEKLKFFVKQDGRTAKTLGGQIVDLNPITFLGVRTFKEARKAVEQFNTIVKNIDEDNIDDVIKANNDWNLSIEDKASFLKFTDEHGLDSTAPVNFAADKDKLAGTPGTWAGNESVGDTFIRRLNDSQRGRGSRPLIGMGGEVLETLRPSEAASVGVQRSSVRVANQRYMFNAVNGWMNAAKALKAFKEEPVPTKSRMQNFLDAKLSDSMDPKLKTALENERNTIRFRMGAVNEDDLNYQKFMSAAADRLYGMGADRLGRLVDRFESLDPVGKLRAIAFHTKLGMFNPDQFLVQGAQIINVMGIASANIGPKGVFQSFAAVMPLRAALMGDPRLVKEIAKRQALVTGISEEDFINLVDYLKSSGRNIVDNTVVEENNTYATFGGKFKRFLDYGQVFFKEGELSARLAAASVDVLERRKKYGTSVDIFADRDSMFRRQDLLTASMTSASAAPWQRSLASIPFQFMTYNMRMIEQLFMKDILTPKEKTTLALTHLSLYGGAALPAVGAVMDRMNYEDPNMIENEFLRDAIRYGGLDATLSVLMGVDTAYSTRLAAGEGMWDFVVSFTSEDTIVEAAIGPGGQIGKELFTDSFRAISNMVTGEFDYLSYDWIRFARTISSVNKAENIRTALRYGEYYNRKTLQAQDINMTSPEVFALALGIPTEEYDKAWSTIRLSSRDNRLLKREAKDIQGQFNLARKAMDEGDKDKFKRILNDVGARLQLMTPSERERVWIVLKRDSSLVESVINQALRNGKSELAIEMQRYLNDS